MSLFEKYARTARKQAAADSSRVPPGQTLTKGFPVLTYGPTPIVEQADWTCTVRGLVTNPVTVDWDELMAMPQTTIVRDIHCVTTWSKLDAEFTGVRLKDFLAAIADRTEVLPEARFVMQHGTGGYTTNTPIEDLLEDDVLIAHSHAGVPLDRDHGGPVRIVLPKLYFWKSAKWLSALEFMPADRPGFWERNGYHNYGDPWKEQRFWE